MTMDHDRRILLAWEGGAGRGHLVTLKRVAEALGPGFTYDAALCDMRHAAEIAPLCDLTFKGALLGYDRAARAAKGMPGTATWGEFMGDLGFRDEAFVASQVRWWQQTIEARASDLVVADYAPCALIAARSLGVPAVAVGTGYGIPPAGLTHFPIFLPEYDQLVYDEAAMVATINAAIVPLGCAALDYLPDVYVRSGDLVRTLAMLDPYGGQREAALLPPVADFGALSDDSGTEIFAYLSTSELDEPDVVEALLSCGLPLRAYLPGADDAMRARFVASGAIVEDAPVPLALIVARSRMLINAGQHGMLCLGLAAGIPQLCLTQHLEHLFHARRAEAAGAVRVLTRRQRSRLEVADTIAQTYADQALAHRARAIAAQIAPECAVDADVMICERLLPLLG